MVLSTDNLEKLVGTGNDTVNHALDILARFAS